MTGYASTRRHTQAGELTISLRSVNHRGLDLHFHLSNELGQFENAMRGLLKQQLRRGHVEVRLSIGRNGEEGVEYNQAVLSRYVAIFRQASAEFGLKSEPDLNALFTLPGVLQSGTGPEPLDNSFETDVMDCLAACLEDLNLFREREGKELCRSVELDLDAIESGTRQMLAIRSQAHAHFVARLNARIRDILQDVNISPARLTEEAALLADRSDVQEELTRLTVHTQEVRRLLQAGGEVGKRLDFLLQEMNRETNTVLSKTSGIGDAGLTITSVGLAIKVNIERMREQALNLE
jgi:uncharacterized protein (TIGR00255 family)